MIIQDSSPQVEHNAISQKQQHINVAFLLLGLDSPTLFQHNISVKTGGQWKI